LNFTSLPCGGLFIIHELFMNRSVTASQLLTELCRHPELRDNAREVNELSGFICAMAASPEPLELQEWFPCLWKQGCEPSFSSATLAEDFARTVLQFYSECIDHYRSSEPLRLPCKLWLDEYQEVTAQGIAFASGYLAGFYNIEALWQELDLAHGSQPEQLLQTTMLLLSKMAAAHSQDPQMQELHTQLPEMQEIVSSLPSLLSALGHFALQAESHG